MKHRRVWPLIVAGLLLLGCAGDRKGAEETEIRKAIEERLASRPGLSTSDMVMELQKVEIQGDTAEAEVLFRTRNDPNATMSFHYQLRKEGGRWKVEPGTPGAGSAPHAMPEEEGTGTQKKE